MPEAHVTAWTGGLRALLEAALPLECAGCAAPGRGCCPECLASLRHGCPTVWWPTPVPNGFPPTWACSEYAGPVRSALVAWKDRDRVDLTRVFAPVLAHGIGTVCARNQVLRAGLRSGHPVRVVPVPSARAGQRRRGRWPVADLVGRALRGVPVELAVHRVAALRLQRRVADQAGLGRVQRTENLRGAMRVPARHAEIVRGSLVVVVDDVVTTGATLAEAARALRAEGAREVVGLTLAATRRRTATGAPPPHVSSPGEPV